MHQTDLQHGLEHNSLNTWPFWVFLSSKPAGFAGLTRHGYGCGLRARYPWVYPCYSLEECETHPKPKQLNFFFFKTCLLIVCTFILSRMVDGLRLLCYGWRSTVLFRLKNHCVTALQE
jgi:hypothetical protein